jgi:hypothetical protein
MRIYYLAKAREGRISWPENCCKLAFARSKDSNAP